jgi:hypothetical protein
MRLSWNEIRARAARFAEELPALRGLELVACGGVFDTNGIGGKNGEARRFLGWNTERHWVLGPHRENDAPAQQ